MPIIKAIAYRECQIACNNLNSIFNPALFFILAASLFPLAINPQPSILSLIAPGVVWVITLLAILVGLDDYFRTDYEDGSLELQIIANNSLTLIVLVRVFSFWGITILPLILIAGLFALMLNLPLYAIPALLLSLLLGTLIMSFVGAIGSALTVGIKKTSTLLGLLLIPLYIPVLIFSTSATNNAVQQLPWLSPIYILMALAVLAVTFAPFACAVALRISLD